MTTAEAAHVEVDVAPSTRDRKAAAQALSEIIDSENPPLRVLFGSEVCAMITGIYQDGKHTWRDREGVSRRAQRGPRAS